jgi:hypothetical protein
MTEKSTLRGWLPLPYPLGQTAGIFKPPSGLLA